MKTGIQIFRQKGRACRRQRTGAIATAIIASIVATSCGTWAGNPKEPEEEPTTSGGDSKVTLDVRGYDESTNLVAGGITVIGRNSKPIGTLTLSEARVVLKEIKIKTDDNDSVSREKFKGPYLVDLLTNQISPAIEEISLKAGAYGAIDLIMAKLEKDKLGSAIDSNDPMIDKSIILSGSYHGNSGSPVDFVMSHDLDEEFKISPAGARSEISISSDRTNSVIIGFYLASWFDFSGQEWDFTDLPSGPIRLEKNASAEAAKKIRESLKENIKDSAEFAHDKDGDGKISDADD